MSTVPFKKPDFVPAETTNAVPAKQRIVIAVDGTAASGKGTLAKKLAERLGYAYLDTGALYRAVAYATLEMKGDPTKIDDVRPALDIVKRNLTPELLRNPALRTRTVTDASSKVATLRDVRAALIDFQRNFASNPPGNVGGAVLDGRDIGTVICPHADVKFFITADVEERARRRLMDMHQAGYKMMTLTEVVEDLKARDIRDATRKTAPTVAAHDAHTIDTTALTPTQVLDETINVIRDKFLEMADDGTLTS